MARKVITAVLSEGELTRLRALPFPTRNKLIQDALAKKMRVKIMARQERERKELMRLRAGRRRNIDPNFIF